MKRLKRFLQSVPSRIVGSYVETKSEHVTTLSSWAKFPADERLELRLKAQRELIGDRPIRADRKLIEDQPDSFVAPRPFDDELPI